MSTPKKLPPKSAGPAGTAKPREAKTFRMGRDAYGTRSIEVSSDGHEWTAAIVGLDEAYVKTQLDRLRKNGARVARPAK
jgi:hypothetical protein